MFLYSPVRANLWKSGVRGPGAAQLTKNTHMNWLSTAVITSGMRHYKLQMLCQTQWEPWQRDEHTHTAVLAQGDPNTPVCAEWEPNGYSLANGVRTGPTAQTCSSTRVAVTSGFNVSLQILASQNLQDSQQDKTVCRDEMSRTDAVFPPPKRFNKIKQSKSFKNGPSSLKRTKSNTKNMDRETL